MQTIQLQFRFTLPCLLLFYQSITTTDFQVCLKDIQRYDAHHDPITVNYLAAGCKYPLIVLMPNVLNWFDCRVNKTKANSGQSKRIQTTHKSILSVNHRP